GQQRFSQSSQGLGKKPARTARCASKKMMRAKLLESKTMLAKIFLPSAASVLESAPSSSKHSSITFAF
ncbi:MAG TPA: hypothetical protein PLK30_19835, partial [Blastocatellia bacterium]|nr:hypothetical protein [Blastocatellia bacterium]